ncbi:quinone oxidoreductase family protein [Phreatobacter cathodiphilus]|uniref:Quinone oxidoreductase n=1 Tax=Phreatobacter cathodiphilus TaxID=1868589 RepID=A0A2S0N9L2_9HYPH|nr:quinone oxidoreductase [Phreatobacter cathodiphilus]AVO44835.1 quinone oxidoreductase [Phreatobacter cathodiphilus]
MVKAIRIHKTGGPDAMVYEDVQVKPPGPGEAYIRQTAIGVNFIDVYYRSGLYKFPSLPHGIGMEAAGVVEAIGPGVTEVAFGDRVAYAGGPPGAYAEKRLIPAAQLVKLPKAVDDKVAAAIMLQGMTARYLLKETHVVKKGDTILVHAAAGGMGLWLCQWAKALGANVIGTTSSAEKAALAKKNGCKFPIIYTEEDFVARVMEITGGKGVQVVYDGVGKDTFLKSLECLAVRGHLVLFGTASGVPDPISPAVLAAKSATLTRPGLYHYIATRKDLLANAKDVFEVVKNGTVTIQKPQEYALKDAAKAHKDLAGRKTTGSIILIP